LLWGGRDNISVSERLSISEARLYGSSVVEFGQTSICNSTIGHPFRCGRLLDWNRSFVFDFRPCTLRRSLLDLGKGEVQRLALHVNDLVISAVDQVLQRRQCSLVALIDQQ
jgi:hypothetical protein